MFTKGMLRDRARGMRKEMSRAESAVWEIVRGSRLGVKFRRQHPVESYIADFACIEAKLIVEVDGLSHDDDAQRAYDAERTRVLAAAGWRVLRLRDGDVLSDSRVAERAIRAALA
jgi:very-short-patch-repair endonuclease